MALEGNFLPFQDRRMKHLLLLLKLMHCTEFMVREVIVRAPMQVLPSGLRTNPSGQEQVGGAPGSSELIQK